MPTLRTLTLAVCLVGAVAPLRAGAQAASAPEVLLRLDDVGMSHSVNTAIEYCTWRSALRR